jgi:hypothetical protein
MKNGGKITGPVFQTFDTSSVNYKPTKLDMDDRVLQNILGMIQRSEKPLLLGPIALWFDLRMNYVLSALQILMDRGQIVKIEPHELCRYGLAEKVDAYWTPEKVMKRI